MEVKHSSSMKVDTSQVLYDLKAVGEILRAARSKKETLDFIVRILQKLGFDRVRIWLIDEDRQGIYGAKSNYIPDKKFQKVKLSLNPKKSSPGLIRGLATKRPFMNKHNPTLINNFGDRKDVVTIGFPLLAGKKILGVISVDNSISGNLLSLSEIEPLTTPFINHIALALHRVIAEEKIRNSNRELKKRVKEATQELAEKNEELSYLATHDPLTDLPNRRDFDDRLAIEFRKANTRKPLTLAILDIDFLKQVNDTQGHLAGDRLIAVIGRLLREAKKIPYAARYAGDEFVILLPGQKCSPKKCLLDGLLPVIRRKIRQGACIGAAAYPGPGISSPLDLIRLADDALYHAKHTGRGRAVCLLDTQEKIPSVFERAQALQVIERSGTTVVDYIKQLEIINEVSEGLRDIEVERAVIKKVLSIFLEKLKFERIRIYIVNRREKYLDCTSAIGIKQSDLASLRLPLDASKSVAADAVLQKKIVDVKNASQQKNFNQQIVKFLKTKATLAIPLIVKNRAIGTLMADYNPDKFQLRVDQNRFFLTLGNHVALALEQARLFAEIRTLNRGLDIKVKNATQKLQQYSRSLEHQIKDNQRLQGEERQNHFDMVTALVASIESKDSYTRGHSVRVASYAQRLGSAAGLSRAEVTDLRYASLLHDVGKLSVEQELLDKHAALTEDELAKISQHPVVGYRILSSVRFLRSVARFVRHHHERWDGHGYPDKLKGEQIPFESRIINIADAYDAMVTRRSYGRKIEKKKAMQEILKDSGKQFDPKLVKLFVKLF